MGLIPHSPIYLSEIRIADVWLLLAVGALWELSCRLILLQLRRKPVSLLNREAELSVLQKETDKKRKLGPAAFVETSKLERQVLAAEKELSQVYLQRKKKSESAEKVLLRYGNMAIALIVFILYYGVPIFTLEGLEAGTGIGTAANFMHGETYLKSLLFPASYIGFGVRISKWGMDPEIKGSSMGALVVMWSGQVTVAKLMDAVDAYVL